LSRSRRLEGFPSCAGAVGGRQATAARSAIERLEAPVGKGNFSGGGREVLHFFAAPDHRGRPDSLDGGGPSP
jgi:hypothetical protein